MGCFLCLFICLFQFSVFIWIFVCFLLLFLFLKFKHFALALNLQIGFRPAYPLVILVWQVMLIKCPKHGASGALWINLSILFTPSILCNVNTKICLSCNLCSSLWHQYSCVSLSVAGMFLRRLQRRFISRKVLFCGKRKDWNVASRVLKASCCSHEKRADRWLGYEMV